MSLGAALRVVIAEDSGLLRELLVRLLTEHGMVVCGQASSLPELLATVAADPPDLVVSDIRMPPTFRDEGIEAAAQIRARHPATGLLILTHYPEAAYAVRLLEIADRAVGYIVKDRVQDTARFLEAARRVAAGETVIDSQVVQEMFHRPRPADPLDRLAPSERRILALIAEGHSNSAIATRLSYSVKTVEKRVTSIGQALGLPSVEDDGRSDVNLRVLAVLAYLRQTPR
ncbi:DNA-binding response regulator [Actinoplanes philippinensis]|uniref:response regulator transcription factor n=1 Tax=Actinoplanes philippinensis TaxID=35752 RepID=UPI001A40ADE4|nr:response regulator transcription factor [Actinoplanes philippinensis]GIE76338.1 DNA-binding response regulator [Actinoplanes philippinensis]